MADDQNLITINDVRRAGFCAAGARRWFDSHGINFRVFLQRGIDSSVLLATGDALALQVVERKQEREG